MSAATTPNFRRRQPKDHQRQASKIKINLQVIRQWTIPIKPTNTPHNHTNETPGAHQAQIRGCPNQTKRKARATHEHNPLSKSIIGEKVIIHRGPPRPASSTSVQEHPKITPEQNQEPHQHSREGIPKGTAKSNHCRNTINTTPPPSPSGWT